MSSGPVETYEGVIGVANDGGNPLLEDLNRYYSVRQHHNHLMKECSRGNISG